MYRLIGIAMLALAGTACAAPISTPYQPAAPNFGYSENHRADGIIEVRFSGNPATERKTVEDYALFRAAELSAGAGYKAFEIIDRTVEIRVRDKTISAEPRIRRPIVTRRGSLVYVETTPKSFRRNDPGGRISYAASLVIRPLGASAVVVGGG